MGLSSSKSKSKSEPYAAAVPYINSGLTANQALFDAQSPRLEAMSQTAQNAFNQIAPSAFGASPFVTSAQQTAGDIFGGKYMGGNPGAATYARLQQQADPSMGVLAGLAGGTTSPGNYNGIGQNNPALGSLYAMSQNGGTNPASALLGNYTSGKDANPASAVASAVAGGQYLNAQPSADMYADTLAGKYLDGNPYLDKIVAQANDTVTTAANRRFAQAGMGDGLSSAFAGVLSKNLADSENGLRFTNYNQERDRQVQVGAQSDSVWSGERGRMDNANQIASGNYNAAQDRGLAASQSLGSLYNAGQDRQLSAATGLGSLYNSTAGLGLQAQQAKDSAFQSDRNSQLAAAQALGGRVDAGNQTAFQAAQAGDNNYNAQMQQMLSALGMTGGLESAQYAGINPALGLLGAAAEIPYTGLNAYAGTLGSLTGKYGTQTGSSSPSLFDQAKGVAGLGAGFASVFSDPRLKTAIEKVGEFADGLGIYLYDYVWGGPRQRGVMADEVARLRPWALGPEVAGFRTVNYEAL